MSRLITPHQFNINLVDAGFDGDKFYARHTQDVSAVMNLNEEQRKNTDDDWRVDKEFKHVGRVPRVIWLLWESMGITEDPKELLKALERHKDTLKTTDKQLI